MFKHRLIALAAIGAAIIGFPAQEASAAALMPQKPALAAGMIGGSTPMLEVRHNRRHRMDYRWDRHRHGHRWHRRSNRYRYYHGGYWYENPWWIMPMIGTGITLGYRNRYSYGSSHVEWCLNRYRSYNVRTNTWVSYSGHVRQCISPYGR